MSQQKRELKLPFAFWILAEILHLPLDGFTGELGKGISRKECLAIDLWDFPTYPIRPRTMREEIDRARQWDNVRGLDKDGSI